MTTLAGGAPVAERRPAGGGARPWHQRPVVAGLLLLAAYVGLSFLNDPRGYLGTDTGIKVATLDRMVEQGTLRPDIGYWAAPWDPDAAAHPFRDTRRIGDQYVDATTLPVLVAAYPLWAVGGYRAALLLPMAGAVAAAFVARGFARRLGGAADGWPAFWLAGLASPLAVYALDLWEHTIGVALMGGGALLLFDLVAPRIREDGPDRPPWWDRWRFAWRGLAAGACFGAAYTMRTEALVYTATTFAVVGGVLLVRRGILPALLAGGAGVVGFALPALGNAMLEVALVGQTIRSSRASGTVAGAGGGLGLRLKEGLVTFVSPFPTFDAEFTIMGVVGVAALAGLAWWGSEGRHRAKAQMATAVVVLVVLLRLQSDLGFWPGLLASTPLAVLGLVRGARSGTPVAIDRRLVLALALVPVPLVIFFQFTGGALPQWGGRYLLTTGFLLAALGAACLPELARWARVAFVALAIGVTTLGLAWLSVRSHQVGDASEALVAQAPALLVWPDGFLPREFASIYGDRTWLAPADPPDRTAALDVVRRSGAPSFGLVTYTSPDAPPPPEVPGFHITGTRTLPFLDPVTLTVTTYEADA